MKRSRSISLSVYMGGLPVFLVCSVCASIPKPSGLFVSLVFLLAPRYTCSSLYSWLSILTDRGFWDKAHLFQNLTHSENKIN